MLARAFDSWSMERQRYHFNLQIRWNFGSLKFQTNHPRASLHENSIVNNQTPIIQFPDEK